VLFNVTASPFPSDPAAIRELLGRQLVEPGHLAGHSLPLLLLLLLQVLDSVDIRSPRVAVLSNVTASPFPSDPAAIRELLGRQLVEPVRWEPTLTGLLSQQGPGRAWGGCIQLYECGPGQQIKAMVRRVDQAAWRAFKNVPAE
jgi:malonyl CoA-acyl carrier protein transacylase